MNGKKRINLNKKILIPIIIILAVLVAIICVVATKTGVFNLSGKENLNANVGVVNGDKGYISSAQIIQTKTGTGPWDADDEPGNDSSEDNNIVRSFDQVTWTVDLTMTLKEGVAESNLTGGIINIEASLPENCANVMKWDIGSMNWIENGNVSTDGRTLTGQYSMTDKETTIPGKQTLVFILSVQGAGNATEIVPTFTFDLEGNEDDEKAKVSGDAVIVSAKGKYNIQLKRNGRLSNKTTVDYGEGSKEGRMYGYTFVMQLYNESESKGLKGVEYPKGDITFDMDLKLQRSEFGTTELTDITNECTPVLWQYRISDWSSNLTGNIPNRNMFSGTTLYLYDTDLPLGVYVNPLYSTYNSGNVNIVQNNNKLNVTIKDYEFNGAFPTLASQGIGNPDNVRYQVYTDNIGTFSIGYMQIFVPDNEASTIGDRNYYLTVSDSNLKMTSNTNQQITTQMNTSDDSDTVEHVLYNPGKYDQYLYLADKDRDFNAVETAYGSGDGRIAAGDILRIDGKFSMDSSNDYDIYTANKFIKFDAEAFEPMLWDDGAEYKVLYMTGDPKFNIWYTTKKDGTNWISQTEMNNGNIEDMDIYDNIEDIPEGKMCTGIYAETISGYISRTSGTSNNLEFLLRVKTTAEIGKTYSLTQRTQMWIDKLDRDVYSVLHPENEYPTPTWVKEIIAIYHLEQLEHIVEDRVGEILY